MRSFFLAFLLLLPFYSIYAVGEQPIVLVSLAPYRSFVKKIAQDLVQVELMVPPGASAHSYEPTAKQMEQASRAKIWFFLGEPFEKKALQALQHAQPDLKVVDLRQGIPLIKGSCHCHDCGEDLHIWLSPELAKIQATTIANALIENDSEHKEFFLNNLNIFLDSLDSLNIFIKNKLAPVTNRVLMVSHPAYAYFCKDFHFLQIPIEFEGKDPTQKQLTALLEKTKEHSVRFIFTQPQYSDKAARLVAQYARAKLISVDPYSEDYENSMRSIATLIAENAQ